MKKNNGKNKKTELVNEVVESLYLHEVEEKKNCDLFKCSFNTGKDKDGNYKKSVPVTVIVTDKTSNNLPEDFETGYITVNGSLAFDYTDSKGKTYLNVKIFASAIGC